MRMRKLQRKFLELLPLLRELDWHDGTDRIEFMLGDIKELIEHGEPGVALENLCQNLYEFSVPITQSDLAALESLAKEMEMPDDTWELLTEVVA